LVIKDNIQFTGNGVPGENGWALKNTFGDHGNEIDEIISKKPSFVVRWGISILFLIALGLLAISWFIQYPDTVNARGSLNSINAPKEVMVQSSGKLIRLFAKEGQQAGKNEVLGYMESTASYDEVIALSKLLDTVSIMTVDNRTNGIVDILPASVNNLGELQASYQIFSQAFTNFSNYLSNGFYLRKRGMLNNDMGYLQRLHSSLQQQKGLLQQDLSLTDTTFKAHKKLKDDKVISEMDYRNEKSKLLAKEMTLPQISSSIISNESQQNEKQKEIAELENQIQQQKGLFVQALNTFKSQLDDWKKKYLLIAPIDGIASFSTFLQENQQLRQGQVICFINPGNSNYYVEALIPQYNFGKVKTGQEVLLKFEAYPYQEFGSVKGRIEFISNAPSDSGYLAKIILPEGLITNYKKTVLYRTGLSMQADIITDKRRLLQRFFSSFRSKLN
jgi:multidrug efflux pump subunit AcrA (membrane-fusion protein)